MQGIDIEKTGKTIKEMCKIKNISVKDIQEKLFIGSFQAVYAWFSGKSLPSLDNLYRLSRLLNVPMDALIVGQQEEHTSVVYANDYLENNYAINQKKVSDRIRIYYMKIKERAA
ncbi:MAG: helix-turn-helix domain-containing protein [Bariatricus sp.]